MKEVYYFAHDYNARNDVNILRLRQKHQCKGYGIYFMILEILCETENHKLPISDIPILAFDLREDESIIKSIINDFDLFVIKNDYFYSESLNRRFAQREAIRKKKQESGYKGRMKQLESRQNDSSTVMPGQNILFAQADPGKERKGKERKRKEKKENIYEYFDFFRDNFKQIWFEEFIPIKKRRKAALTERALLSQLNKIKTMSGGDYEQALLILSTTCEKGWTDFYPVKTEPKLTPTTQTKYLNLENYETKQESRARQTPTTVNRV